MKNSFVLQWYDKPSKLLESIGIEMSKQELEKIEQFQKDSTTFKSNPKKVEQKLNLYDYFYDDMSKEDRNKAIFEAYHDGFMQSEIAKFLGITSAGVSKILKKLRV